MRLRCMTVALLAVAGSAGAQNASVDAHVTAARAAAGGHAGMTEFSTWAVTTSDGIIVTDAVFDCSVEAAVVRNTS